MFCRGIRQSRNSPGILGLRPSSTLRTVSRREWRRSLASKQFPNHAQNSSTGTSKNSGSSSPDLNPVNPGQTASDLQNNFTQSLNSSRPSSGTVPVDNRGFKYNRTNPNKLNEEGDQLNTDALSKVEKFGTDANKIDENSQHEPQALPDLTQGIPSTLEYSTDKITGVQNLALTEKKTIF